MLQGKETNSIMTLVAQLNARQNTQDEKAQGLEFEVEQTNGDRKLRKCSDREVIAKCLFVLEQICL